MSRLFVTASRGFRAVQHLKLRNGFLRQSQVRCFSGNKAESDGFWGKMFPGVEEPPNASNDSQQGSVEEVPDQTQAGAEENNAGGRETDGVSEQDDPEVTGRPLTKAEKHKRKIAKSQKIMRELERTVGVRYAVNKQLQPLKRGSDFPANAFPIVMKSLDGSQFEVREVCSKAPATVFFASANNAASQPTVTKFHDAFVEHFGYQDDGNVESHPQAYEFSIGSTGLLQQFMSGMLEGFLRKGTPAERQPSTAYITKNTSNLKMALGMDDILVGFFYVCDRDGRVSLSGRCDEEKVDAMLASVEEVIAAEEAAAERAEAEAAAEKEAKRKKVVDTASVEALKKAAANKLKSN